MNTWKDFKIEVRKKLITPWNNPPFLGYFLVCVIIGGAAGVYISIYEYASSSDNYKIAISLGTYYSAIMATAFADINLSKRIESKPSFFIYSLLICLFGAILLIATYLLTNCKFPQWAFLTSGLGCLLSLLLWIIANADNENLKSNNLSEEIHTEVNLLTKNW
jgi:membrane associated rhomboid family serine protease